MTSQQDVSKAFEDHAAALQQASNSTPVPPAVSKLLGQLALLEGVPFEHLVPDSRMLPPESIRFFYLDNNWVHSLVDGALSIGIHSDRDIRFHTVMQHVVRKAADVAAGNLRSEALAEASGDAPAAGSPSANLNLDPRRRAGFLMRSAVVSGWPGLEVRGFVGPGDSLELKLLRLVRLAPDVLLAIFEDLPGLIFFKEPDEDLHFGIRGGHIGVRDPEALAAGPIVNPPPNAPEAQVTFRPNATAGGVVNIRQLAQDLRPIVPGAGATLGPALFAIQMVDPPDKKQFVPEAGV